MVINQQLTIGQLVASELVVTVVVGAFAKAGKSFEKFYDAMAAIDKVGHLLDIPVDPRVELGSAPTGPVGIRWDELEFHISHGETRYRIAPATIEPGSCVAIRGTDRNSSTLVVRALAGLIRPHRGLIEVAGLQPTVAIQARGGSLIGLAGRPEIFHGTILENVALGRPSVGAARVREVLRTAVYGMTYYDFR